MNATPKANYRRYDILLWINGIGILVICILAIKKLRMLAAK